MTVTADPFSGPASTDPGRDRWGIRWTKHKAPQGGPRPYIYDPEAGKEVVYTRCTSFIKCLEDTSVLEKWKLRIVLVGLRAAPDLIEETARTDPEDKAALESLASRAFEAGDGYVAAQKGTDLHALSERVDREGRIPEGLSFEDRRDMAAYQREMAAYGIRPVEIERRVVIDRYQVTGTFDRLVEHEGKRRIFDLKTGRIDYGQGTIAMQLAMYRQGQYYDGWTRERTPMEDVDARVGLVGHLPQGEGRMTVWKVDLVAGWAGILLADQVRAWRKRSDLFTLADHPDPFKVP